MQFIGIEHLAPLQLPIDIEEAHAFSIGESREIFIRRVDGRQERRLSYRGKIAVRMMVASGALARITSTIF